MLDLAPQQSLRQALNLAMSQAVIKQKESKPFMEILKEEKYSLVDKYSMQRSLKNLIATFYGKL